MEEEEVGVVVKYFARVGVAAVNIEKGELEVGDTIHIKGHTTDFKQIVESMQIENKPVDKAKPGDAVGIKVRDRVRANDIVSKVKDA
ncbi:translation elongation factor-like protein [Candidatus Aerophobetes bacterium]|nr:translation elongation factor-like protein [Candidatus Aerophobetes bacterium]